MYTVSTSNYHHGNLREALLAAGLEKLESEQSPEFSLRELTRQVGVSVNAAYRHFASKDDLLCAMAAEGFRLLCVDQAAAMQADTVEQGFREAGRAYVNFARRHPALFRLMFSRFAVTNRNDELNAGAQLAYDGMRFGVAAILNKPVENADVKIVSMFAWSLVHGLSHLIIDGQFDIHTDDIDGLVDAVLQHAAAPLTVPPLQAARQKTKP